MKEAGICRFFPIGEAVSALLFPYGEVVIHDLQTSRIAAIYNSFSKRKVGDESLLGDARELLGIADSAAPYFKENWDGKKLKSISVFLRNDAGKPVALLCINVDISVLEEVQLKILDVIKPLGEKSDYVFKSDWREKINTYVSGYLKKEGKRIDLLDKLEKKMLLLALQKEGAFETKNAASYIADVLQISRATVYNYLKEKDDTTSV